MAVVVRRRAVSRRGHACGRHAAYEVAVRASVGERSTGGEHAAVRVAVRMGVRVCVLRVRMLLRGVTAGATATAGRCSEVVRQRRQLRRRRRRRLREHGVTHVRRCTDARRRRMAACTVLEPAAKVALALRRADPGKGHQISSRLTQGAARLLTESTCCTSDTDPRSCRPSRRSSAA
jgi:hypothetical protein